MMSNNDNDIKSLFVCHGCIGDAYLKDEIKTTGKQRSCMNCKKRRQATPFSELCDRVHEIVSEEFTRTPSEPENWSAYKESEYGWDRDGEPIESVLYEILECDGLLIQAVKERLSDLHFSFDDAAAGEEDPYGDEVQYELAKPNDYEYQDAWSTFQNEIRTQARFFSRTAEKTLDGIFGEQKRFRTRKRPLIRNAGPGTATAVIFRARRAFSNGEIARIVEHPARELGAPPSQHAGSGRMNPRWISMFYGALDPDTCIAEIRAPVGSSVVIGKFDIIRPLKLLDLEAFRELIVDRASFFDPDFRGLRDKAKFLGRLVDIMSRPVMPGDEDFNYLPTQAVAEYLSEKIDPPLDGLIFPSSQRDGKGENVVLFRRACGVEPDGSEGQEVSTNFGWSTDDDYDDDITVWTKKKRKKKPKKKAGLFDFEAVWDGPLIQSEENAALRIDLAAIEVRDIKAIEYSYGKRHVRRLKEPTGKLPF